MNDKSVQPNKAKLLRRRENTIWHMYVLDGWSMREIGEIFKFSKSMIHKIIMDVYRKNKRQVEFYRKTGGDE